MSKKQPKLTPRFPPDARPARVGVYQHEFHDTTNVYFSNWNGEYWCANTWDINEAPQREARSNSVYQPEFAGWRGLAVKP